MKLATLKDGTRDGTLIVVSRDLKHAIKADDIADMTFEFPRLIAHAARTRLRPAGGVFLVYWGMVRGLLR